MRDYYAEEIEYKDYYTEEIEPEDLLRTTPAPASTTGMPWERTYGLPETPTPPLTGLPGFAQRFVGGAEQFATGLPEMAKGLARVAITPTPQREVAIGQMAGEMGKDVLQRLTRPSKTWEDPFGTALYVTPGIGIAGAKLGAGLAKMGGKALLRKAGLKPYPVVPWGKFPGGVTKKSAIWQLDQMGQDLNMSLQNIFKATEKTYKEGIPGKPKEIRKKMGDIWEGDIAEGRWSLQRFKKQLRKALPHEGHREIAYRWLDDQSEAIAQGRGNIWQKDFDMLPAEGKHATKIARDIFDNIQQIESAAGLGVEYKQWYTPHFWKPVTEPVARGLGRVLRKRTPHALEQKFETIQRGIEAGREPATTDLLDVLGRRVDRTIEITSNRNLINNLRKAVDPETGNPLVVNSSEAMERGLNYPRIEAPSLRRDLRVYEGIRVHPDIYPEMKMIFGEGSKSGILRALLTANAAAKKTLLATSLFHWHALTESAIASGVGKQAPKGFAESVGAIFGREPKGLKGLQMYWKGDPHLRMGMRNGLVLGPTEDVGRAYGLINRTVNSITERIPVLEKPGKLVNKTLGKAEQAWDKGLWDTYHSNFKAYAFVEHYQQLLKKKPNVPTQKIAEEAARLTNFAFGGLNWRRLMVEPKYRNALQLIFLAPDWTLSNLGVGMSAIPGAGKIPALGRFGQTAGMARGMYANYWLRAITYFTGFTELANYAFTKMKTGKGHFTWDNPPGHEFDVELPYRAKDQYGREGDRFLKVGKQFKEPFRLIWDVGKMVRGKAILPEIVKSKLGILPRAGYEQLTGETMYGYPWLRGSRYQPREMGAFEELGRRGLHTAEELMPIPAGYMLDALRGKDVPSAAISALGFPVAKATSRYKLMRQIVDARIKGDTERARGLWVIAREQGLYGTGKGQFDLSDVKRLQSQLSR